MSLEMSQKCPFLAINWIKGKIIWLSKEWVKMKRKTFRVKNNFCPSLVIFLFTLLSLIGLIKPGLAQYQGKIEGTVVDSANNPVEKAEVIIISQWSTAVNYHLETDKQGHFIQIGLRPGYFLLEVRKAGYLPRSLEVKVHVAETTKVEIKLEKAQELAERNISQADKLFLQGNKLYAEKKYEEAVLAYQEAIKLSPSHWGYHFNLGLAYKKLQQEKEATAAFRQAQALNPDSFSANKELGESLAKQGDFQEARVYYEKAVALSPDDADAAYNLGVCLVNLSEPEKALNYFQKTVELNKDYADAYYQMGTIFISLNRVAEAVDSLETFIKLAPPSDPRTETAKQLIAYLKK